MSGVKFRDRESVLTVGFAFVLLSGAVLMPVFTGMTGDHGLPELTFDTWLNDKRGIFSENPSLNVNFDHKGDPLIGHDDTRSEGGLLEWSVKIADHDERGYLSTPALVDLDGAGGTEVVIASTADVIHAVDCNGNDFWPDPYTEARIDYMGQHPQVSGLDFDPPHFFSNPAAYTFDKKEGPLIFIGTSQGILCLDRYGERKWLKGEESAYYQSTPAITDMEGDFSDPSEMEIIIGSDDYNRRGWLEGFSPGGEQLFKTEVPGGGEGTLIGCGIVAQDLDGDFWDGPDQIEPGIDKERDAEFTLGTHDRGLRIFGKSGTTGEGKPIVTEKTDGWLAGHQTDATHAVANVDDDPACEIFVGSAEGYTRTWTGWGGRLYAYTPDSKKLWDFYTGEGGAAVFSSPVIADLQLSRFDPAEEHLDYEVIFGCDDGYLYVLNTETHSLLWKYDTGGRIQSSPAICNIDGDDELEIIVSSDSGYVYCFDGDPSDGIDEGQKHPGDGFNRDILWKYEMPDAAGMSSPVVGDIDNDRMLECVIGDSSGVLHSISCGGYTFRGLMEWPEFHGNHNRTGYYSNVVNFGIDVHPRVFGPGKIEEKTKLAEPGDTVIYDLSLTTHITGMDDNDRYRIFLGIQPFFNKPNWTAWLEVDDSRWNSKTGSILLNTRETIDFTAVVKAPYEGDLIDTEIFKIKANYSIEKWAMDELQITTSVKHVLDFDLDYLISPSTDPLDPLMDHKWDKMRPGSTADYPILLKNTGTLNDTYGLSLNPPPGNGSWDWYFQESGTTEINISLPARIFEDFGAVTSIRLTVQVVCPPDAIKDSQLPIILSGSSWRSLGSDGGEVIRSDEMYIVVGQFTDLHMWLQEPVVYLSPGGVLDSTLFLSNLGNSRTDMYLNVGGTGPGWDVRFPEGSIPLYYRQTKSVNIRIRPPGDLIPAGSRFNIRIIGTIEGSPHHQSEAMLTVVIKQVCVFEIRKTDEITDKVYPGEDAGFGMEIVNHGNGEDTLEFAVEECEIGTGIGFRDPSGRTISGMTMRSGEYQRIYLNLSVPEGTKPGHYRTIIRISNEHEDRYLVFELRVLQIHMLSISSEKDELQYIMEATPGTDCRITYKVSNLGNGLDIAEIRAIITQDNGASVPMSGDWNPTIMGVSTVSGYAGRFTEIEGVSELNLSGVKGSMYYSLSDVNLSSTSNVQGRFILVLDPGQTAWVHLKFHLPRSMALTSSEGIPVTLIAGNAMLANPAVMRVHLEFKYPLLRIIGGLDASAASDAGKYDAREGDLVTIIAMIENCGDADAHGVEVQMYVDNVRMKNITIPMVRIEKDAYRAVFTWIAQAGTHTIKVVVDPDNGVLERGEIPDVVVTDERQGEEVRIRVKEESAWMNEGAVRYFLIILPLILILASVLVGAYILAKRKDVL
ncbi:MAG: CARDB domain-containing protein [Thermoplasmatota archaeon]